MFLIAGNVYADSSYATVVGQEVIVLYSEPSASSQTLRHLPYGTKVEVLIDAGEFATGYVLHSGLSALDDERIDLAGMPKVGYVVVNLSQHPMEMQSQRYQFSDMECFLTLADHGVDGSKHLCQILICVVCHISAPITVIESFPSTFSAPPVRVPETLLFLEADHKAWAYHKAVAPFPWNI